MLTKFIFPILLLLAVLFQSCDEYKKTDSGLKYKIVVDSAGKEVEPGEVMSIHMEYSNEKDSMSTYERGEPMQMRVSEDFKEGSFEEGLTLLSQGDSAVFQVLNDSLYKSENDSLPEGIEPGSYTTFKVKVVKVYSKDEVTKIEEGYKKEQEAQLKMREEEQKKAFEQLEKDTLAIKSYLKSKGIKAQRTKTGVFYVVKKEGKGEEISIGDSVTVHYTGRFMNGEEFETSKGKQPITFQAGVGGVIYGWDELIQNLAEGDKVTAYIPSILAYGPYGSPPKIGPNENLVFDMEVVEVKKRAQL